jgi:hypothetical protein
MYCKRCDSGILVSTEHLKLLFSFTISSNGLVLGAGELINTIKRSGSVEPEFYCPECGKIPLSSVYALCDQCGHKFDLSDIFKWEEESCSYCENCGTKELKLDPSHKIPLSKICQTMYLKKGE